MFEHGVTRADWLNLRIRYASAVVGDHAFFKKKKNGASDKDEVEEVVSPLNKNFKT